MSGYQERSLSLVGLRPSVPVEKIKHGAEIGRHDPAMRSSGHLDVLMIHAEFFHFRHHGARLFDGGRGIGVAMDDELRDVFHLRHRGRIAAAGERSNRGPDLRIARGEIPRATAAHRVAGEVDAVGIDFVVLPHQVENVQHVLLAEL